MSAGTAPKQGAAKTVPKKKPAPKPVSKPAVKTVTEKKRAPVKRTLPGDGVELYSAEEIAARLRIGRTLAFYLMGIGAIESFKVAGLRRVTREALERYVELQIEMTSRRLA